MRSRGKGLGIGGEDEREMGGREKRGGQEGAGDAGGGRGEGGPAVWGFKDTEFAARKGSVTEAEERLRGPKCSRCEGSSLTGMTRQKILRSTT